MAETAAKAAAIRACMGEIINGILDDEGLPAKCTEEFLRQKCGTLSELDVWSA